MPLSTEEKARRIIAAILGNIDTWAQQCEEIAEAAHTGTGNRARALHLEKALLQAKMTLERIMDTDTDE